MMVEKTMDKIKHFTASDIEKQERFFRANLINSITGYKPANLIGTFSEGEIANLAMITSVVHLGANPPLVGYIQRPVGELSHTYKNIKKNHCYSINHVHQRFVENAHYTSAKFDVRTSEFTACGLTLERVDGFFAPFVLESAVRIGCRFVQEIPVELNRTIMIIGRIEHVLVRRDAVLDDGNVDLNLVNDVCVTGLGTYHKPKKLKSFPYAGVKNLPKF